MLLRFAGTPRFRLCCLLLTLFLVTFEITMFPLSRDPDNSKVRDRLLTPPDFLAFSSSYLEASLTVTRVFLELLLEVCECFISLDPLLL